MIIMPSSGRIGEANGDRQFAASCLCWNSTPEHRSLSFDSYHYHLPVEIPMPNLSLGNGNWTPGWSSYRAAAGLRSGAPSLTTFGCLRNSASSVHRHRLRYQDFVKDGLENRPWKALEGQVYLGSEHSSRSTPQSRELKEIPTRSSQRAVRPRLVSI